MARRSIGTPLTIGIVAMLLLSLLAAGWQVLVWSGVPLSGSNVLDWVLLVLGTLFFLLVMIGLVWLCAWLIREMRLNQRQQAFVDAVTHELRTPLASFRLYLDTLSRHDLPAEKRSDFIDNMRQDLDRLEHTVSKVLAAASTEVPGSGPLRERVDLSRLLSECIEQVRERYRLPEESFVLRSQPAVQVRGDSVELGMIFNNLLENAVKYSEEPIDVRVGVSPMPDGRMQVEISDRGIGIPSWELRKIFQRFYRAGRDVQRQVAGLGLGLFVVRNLVRRQGGKVVASSEGAGRGSRFVVTLRADRT